MISLVFSHFNSGVYTLGEQVALSAMACLLAPTILIMPLALFNSLKYVIIDEDCIIFKHAITEREKCYKFKDIESLKKVETKIATYIKLKFHKGKSKSLGVAMVTDEQLKSIFRILSDKTSNN